MPERGAPSRRAFPKPASTFPTVSGMVALRAPTFFSLIYQLPKPRVEAVAQPVAREV